MNRAASDDRLALPVVEDLHRVEPAIDELHRVEAEIRSMQQLMEGVPPALQSLDPLIELSQGLDRAQRAMRQALEPLEEQLAVYKGLNQLVAELQALSSPSTLQEIERTAQVEGIAEITASLQARLGQRVTAYLGGVKDAKMVGRWARGKVKPRELAELRLRAAYPAAELLASAYGTDTARAWFFGTNTRLGGEAPAHLLRHGEPPFRELLPAARAFVQGDVS